MNDLPYCRMCLWAAGLLLAACCASAPAAAYAIRGQVMADRWHGLSGATVTLSGAAQATTITGGDGAFEFTGLAVGAYRITPTMAGLEFDPPFQNLRVVAADVRAETAWAYSGRPHLAESIIMRFRPPLGEAGTSAIGAFDSAADVTVVISEPGGLPFFAFSKDGGLDRIGLDMANQVFSLDWHTDRADVYPWLTTGVVYRLWAVKAGKAAGYVDCVFGATEEEARSHATERTYAAALGSVVPVRFRLDRTPYSREVAFERLKRFLVTHDPNRGHFDLREHSITVLDELHKADLIGWPPIFEASMLDFYRFMMDRALTQIESEPVDSEAAIWRGYSFGNVVKTPGLILAHDMSDYDWLTGFDARLAPLLDVMMVSHWHPDHYDPALAQAVINAGGEVVAPNDVGIRTITMADGQQVALPGLSIWAHRGVHENYLNLQYEVTTADGLHSIHTGDTDSGDIPNGTGAPLDVLMYTTWYAAPNLQLKAASLKPGCILPGHMQETAREMGSRVTYATAFSAARLVNAPHFPVMTWGERYQYRRGNLPPTCRAVILTPQRLAGVPISFRALPSDWDGTITSIAWTFGDGGSASGDSVAHTFARPGTYPVACQVIDDDGASGGAWLLIKIAPVPPTCAVTWSPETPRAANPVEFDSHAADPDGEVVSVTWIFGDGRTGAGAVASHTYAQPGSYSVMCMVTDGEGLTVTCRATVAVGNALPTCAPVWEPETPVAGETVTFDARAADPDGSVASVEWDFGDGESASGEQAEHVFAAAGRYMITCTVTDDDGETAVCADEIEVASACQADLAMALVLTPLRAKAGRAHPMLVGVRNLGPEDCAARVTVAAADGPPLASRDVFVESHPRRVRPLLLWPVLPGDQGPLVRLTISVEPLECGDPDGTNNTAYRTVRIIGRR